MIPFVTAGQMREIEALEFSSGVPEAELSDRAAAVIRDRLIEILRPGEAVLIIAGPGNNGLDAVKAHRLLLERGVKSTLYPWHRHDFPAGFDPALLASNVERASLVLDGLFGIGLVREVEGEPASIIDAISAGRDSRRLDADRLRVVAIDVPSGLNADTGATMGKALRADLTLTLGLPKIGLFTGDGPQLAGTIRRESIGLDVQTLETAGAVGFNSSMPTGIPARESGSHKNKNGRLLIIGGSLRYPGAPVLAALAAHRAGAGYVTVGFPRSMLGPIAAKLVEPTLLPLPESDIGTIGPVALEDAADAAVEYKALVIGNGIGREPETISFVQQFLGIASPAQRRSVGFRVSAEQPHAPTETKLPPVVVDGDGLYALSERDAWWDSTPSVALLTPHPGEMATLLGKTVDEVQADRIGLSKDAAARWGKTVLLKGDYPLVASPDGAVEVLIESHPELGTAGTGDVLAGICGFLLSLGLEPAPAARTALILGARAATAASASVGRDCVGASDLIAALPAARREREP